MQPPISMGTMLQKRYRVTKVLGQGGFGRTYLSQDTACFDELCVLKEFSPNDRGKDAMKKSQELFQREAKVLYQIDHPQIPKFRANFEEQKRLFLVQEYAEGKTVSKTLTERLKGNQTFTEAEAIAFLTQMLPILGYIHNIGIIHRDISPDNIIFRERDNLPVLIDFGVVKAGVTQLEACTEIHQGTTVGKAGYAPTEQLQTGESYANSDLYALAVTIVVMMTGRKPESLVDKSTMTWKWHQWVPNLTPQFAKILNKMLARVPANRYQSATEVLQAIRANSDYLGPSATIETPSGYHRTMAFSDGDRSVTNVRRTTTIRNGQAVDEDPKTVASSFNPISSILSSPWGMATTAAALLLGIIGISTFLIVQSMSPTKTKNTPTATTATSPAPISPAAPSVNPVTAAAPETAPAVVSPSPVASITYQTENLALEAGKPIIKDTTLPIGQGMVYTLDLKIGQQLKTKLLSSLPTGTTISIMAPNQTHVDARAKATLEWSGAVPLDGVYRIEVAPPPNSTSTNTYQLEVTTSAPPATAPAASPTPTPSVTSSP
jgi:serine/threonine protein kinase